MNQCENQSCKTPRWMKLTLLFAGIYCLGFASWVISNPHSAFNLLKIEKPNMIFLWQSIGVFYAIFGIGLLSSARDPLRQWRSTLLCFIKIIVVTFIITGEFLSGNLPLLVIGFLIIDDLIWLLPFAIILWSSLQFFVGRPNLYQRALSIKEASDHYKLSSGETLSEASNNQPIVLIFLRHFGCTFTRQLIRGLEKMELQAKQKNARLVLVHMLQSGTETQYLSDKSEVARISDPYCELYRSFGLGKGKLFELFGPKVIWKAIFSLFKGCGVGLLAGDGFQMPGAFVFHENKLIISQPAHNSSDLPDIEKLFNF
jgi:hypothetical protein